MKRLCLERQVLENSNGCKFLMTEGEACFFICFLEALPAGSDTNCTQEPKPGLVTSNGRRWWAASANQVGVTESLNIPSWKGPKGIINSNSWSIFT